MFGDATGGTRNVVGKVEEATDVGNEHDSWTLPACRLRALVEADAPRLSSSDRRSSDGRWSLRGCRRPAVGAREVAARLRPGGQLRFSATSAASSAAPVCGPIGFRSAVRYAGWRIIRR